LGYVLANNLLAKKYN